MSEDTAPHRPQARQQVSSLRDRPARPIRDRLVGELEKRRAYLALFGEPVEPTRIGRFTLLEHLGSGGMGRVFAAYDEQLDRKVAIKLVRPGRKALQRGNEQLEREARTLAQLSHPNVVQVYEVGRYRDEVFVAMEFVRGQSLRVWLAEARGNRGWRAWQGEVLAMFIAVGRGLEAAHRAGLVHRDFKPENVLVGADGRPRVLDFGLAQVIDTPSEVSVAAAEACAEEVPPTPTPSADDELDRRAEPTRAEPRPGGIAGTLPYMAPEQLQGQPADPRSDQFAFCVALCEALTGERPFAGDSPAALRRAHERGPRALTETRVAVAAPIRRALVIGLDPAPERRFSDLGALLDLLEQSPRRRRRRVLVAGVAAAVAGLGVAGYALATQTPSPCADAGAHITARWSPDRKATLGNAVRAFGLPYAERSWQTMAGRLDDYVAGLSEAYVAACAATHVLGIQSEELLDRRVLCLDHGRRRLDALLARFDNFQEHMVEGAVAATASLPEYEICSAPAVLFHGVEPPGPAIAARVDELRESLAEATTLSLLGDYPGAILVAQAQVEPAAAIGYEPAWAEAMHTAGWLRAYHGGGGDERSAGEQQMLEALALAERCRHDVLVAEIWTDLTLVARENRSSTRDGLVWSQLALGAIGRIGDPPGLLARAYRHLALLHYKDKRLDQAERAHRRGLELLPDDAPALRRAAHLSALATTVRDRGQIDEARRLYERALSLLRAELDDSHPAVADKRFDLATFELSQGEMTRALAVMSEVREVYERAYGPNHRLVGQSELELAEIERRRGDYDRAYEHALRARDIYGAAYPPDHIEHAEPALRLGAIAVRQGRFGDAVAAYEQALARRRQHLAPDHFLIGIVHANLAEAYLGQGRPRDALRALDAATAVFAAHSASADLDDALAGYRGQIYFAQRRFGDAVAALEPAVAYYAGTEDAPAERADALWALARALTARRGGDRAGDLTRAHDLARQALDLYDRLGAGEAHHAAAIRAWLRATRR
ncbi:protein kinase domain-containing protein [Haliangium sp.]|uniref:protein kinase domain-containing protein n=1 Tax=Haliangium sp. TaxID=2663208 RepID=UPI003D1078F1